MIPMGKIDDKEAMSTQEPLEYLRLNGMGLFLGKSGDKKSSRLSYITKRNFA